MLEQMLLLSVASLWFSGFLSLDFLREEMLAHPAQPLPTIHCVSVHRTQARVMPRGSHRSTTSPKLM